MTIIRAESVTKEFLNSIKQPGLRGSIRSFFRREYRRVQAVNEFSLNVQPGEVVGLLGPNGAGKTTFMKMCTGLIDPTGGELTILGHVPFQRDIEFRRQISLVMGQKSQLWWDIPAHDSFLLLRAYYEIPQTTFSERLNYLTELLDVRNLLNVHVRKLSLGERMKMELIASLLHNPKILFLDEPTIGLDVVAQRRLREFIATYQKEHHTTVLLTSHYMADVAALCSRIVLILDGKSRFDGPLEKFEGILGREKFVTLEFSEPISNNDQQLAEFDPDWDESRARVTLRIPESKFRETIHNLTDIYPIRDLSTDALPIERVMHSLLESHELEKASNG